jgi:hypothetical protein
MKNIEVLRRKSELSIIEPPCAVNVHSQKVVVGLHGTVDLSGGIQRRRIVAARVWKKRNWDRRQSPNDRYMRPGIVDGLARGLGIWSKSALPHPKRLEKTGTYEVLPCAVGEAINDSASNDKIDVVASEVTRLYCRRS